MIQALGGSDEDSPLRFVVNLTLGSLALRNRTLETVAETSLARFDCSA